MSDFIKLDGWSWRLHFKWSRENKINFCWYSEHVAPWIQGRAAWASTASRLRYQQPGLAGGFFPQRMVLKKASLLGRDKETMLRSPGFVKQEVAAQKAVSQGLICVCSAGRPSMRKWKEDPRSDSGRGMAGCSKRQLLRSQHLQPKAISTSDKLPGFSKWNGYCTQSWLF